MSFRYSPTAFSTRKCTRACFFFFLFFFCLKFCGSTCIFRHNMTTDRKKIVICLADQSILVQCSLTTSIRGGPILWDTSQYSYYRIQTHRAKFKSLWKCRHPKCKARVHTNDVANVIIRRRNDHNHQINVLNEILEKNS